MENKTSLLKKRSPYALNFCAITYQNDKTLQDTLDLLTPLYGSIRAKSAVLPFSTFTSFYEPEMGSDLKKCLISFEDLILLENFHLEKLKTSEIEQKYAFNKKRIFNIDIGYLILSKVVLFSTKDFSHRVYLNKGIYAQVTLIYNKKEESYIPFYYTYKDFIQKPFIDFLNAERNYYQKQMFS